MEALKRKWNSSRGASILLALLFLLVCMMAAASILVAAASNAGKLRSNKEEQQKYLTLSSAMTMLVDELESVEYVGKYTYNKQVVYVDETGAELKDVSGNPYTEDTIGEYEGAYRSYSIHTYTQQKGDLTSTGTSMWLDTVLPLRNDLDYIFAKNFEVPDDEQNSEDEYKTVSLLTDADSSYPADPKEFYTLEFQVNDTGNEFGGLSDQVHIKVTLRQDGSILLSATLWEKGKVQADGTFEWKETDYTMGALLSMDSDDWPKELLVLPGKPDNEHWVSDNAYKTDAIKWKLEYIFKTGGGTE